MAGIRRHAPAGPGTWRREVVRSGIRLLRHMRANLVAYLALFVALGGTSYAAGVFPRNSVGTQQVIDHSLLARDFRRGQLPRGSRGVPGPPGPAGERGPAGTDATIAGVPAGGDLTGTYPNPQVARGVIGPSKLADAEPWHEIGQPGQPPFRNGWHNADAGQSTAAYFVDGYGVVHLKGVVAGGTVSAGETGEIFEIPCGYGPKPAATQLHLAVSASGAALVKLVTPATYACGGIPELPAPSLPASVRVATGSAAWVSLDGISWRASEPLAP